MKYIGIVIFSLLMMQLDAISQCVQASGTVVITEPGCDGVSGQIEVTATGGTGPYEYGIGGWTTQSSNVFTGLSAGSYNIRIITADNCESWVNGVVISYTPMEFSGSIVQQTCNDYVAGSVNILPSRGLAPYTYSNDGGATYNSVNFFQQLDVGTYDYKVKDANGCIEEVDFTITKSHIDPSVTTTAVQCTGIMGTAAVTFGGPDNYTFSIDNNASVQSASGTYSYTQLDPGSYQIQCSDINGCNESFDFVVEDENISSSITNLVQETCNEENAGFTIATSNGVGPYEYSIDGGLTFVLTDQFVSLDEGVYQAKVIDSRGCESVETVVINNTGGVDGSINQDTVICNGDGSNLSVSAQGESLVYNWNNGLSNSSSHAVNPSVTTVYNVSIEDTYGCVLPLSTTVTVNDYPNLIVSETSVDLCMGDSIEINSSGAGTYLWSNGDTIGNTVVRTPFGANNIIAYGYNGVCETSIAIPVNVHSIDASITDSQHVCTGSSVALYVNSVTPVLYNWLNSSASGAIQNVSPTVDTEYAVVLTDGYGCEDTLVSTVVVDAAVYMSVTPLEVETCLGESYTLMAAGATNYEWSDGQLISTVTHIATGNEVVSVTGINGECSQTKSVLVTVLPSPIVDITSSASSLNTGDGVQFGVGSSSNASSYLWDFGDGGTANYSIPYHNFLFAGAYNVILTGNIGSCTTTDTLLVYVGVVGVETNQDVKFLIYPNPTSDYITIENEETTSFNVKIINTNGQVVKARNIDDSHMKISLKDLAKGTYYIHLESNKNSVIKTIIKN